MAQLTLGLCNRSCILACGGNSTFPSCTRPTDKCDMPARLRQVWTWLPESGKCGHSLPDSGKCEHGLPDSGKYEHGCQMQVLHGNRKADRCPLDAQEVTESAQPRGQSTWLVLVQFLHLRSWSPCQLHSSLLQLWLGNGFCKLLGFLSFPSRLPGLPHPRTGVTLHNGASSHGPQCWHPL